MMTTLFAIGAGAVLGGWTAWLWVDARRAGHVVVVRVRGHGALFLGRQPHGRYELVHPAGLPALLARFEAQRTVQRARAVRAFAARPLRWHRTVPTG